MSSLVLTMKLIVWSKFYEISKEILQNFVYGSKTNIASEFPLRVSPEEYKLIQVKESILLVGRSGTGKTTCAILRMWGLHWANAKLAADGFGLLHRNPLKSKEEKVNLTETTQFNQLFVTVSPVLCDFVTAYWQGLQGSLLSSTSNIRSNFGFVVASGHQIMDTEQLYSLKDVPSNRLPLITTFAQFLEILDGTFPDPFFATAESLSAGP